MLLAEPPRSPYDLHFSLFGIPVRVHPLFWLVAVLLGNSAGTMIGVLSWVAAVFVAILVHELGHALVMRHFGLQPWITLYSMGGLAGYHTSQLAHSRANTWIRQIFIHVAGPGSGFVLGLVVAGIIAALGQSPVAYFRAMLGEPLVVDPGTPLALVRFAFDLLYISVVWGLVNLLPVYPLDGGQTSREIFLHFGARSGIRNSLILSVVTAGSLAAFALARVLHNAQVLNKEGGSPGHAFRSASLFVALFFGYLAYGSYATLQAYGDGRGRW